MKCFICRQKIYTISFPELDQKLWNQKHQTKLVLNDETNKIAISIFKMALKQITSTCLNTSYLANIVVLAV